MFQHTMFTAQAVHKAQSQQCLQHAVTCLAVRIHCMRCRSVSTIGTAKTGIPPPTPPPPTPPASRYPPDTHPLLPLGKDPMRQNHRYHRMLPVAIMHKSSSSLRAAFVVPCPLAVGVSGPFALPGWLAPLGDAGSAIMLLEDCCISTST